MERSVIERRRVFWRSDRIPKKNQSVNTLTKAESHVVIFRKMAEVEAPKQGYCVASDITCAMPERWLSIKLLVMNHPEIGKFICEIRQEIGLTQKQLATEVGLAYLTVNQRENRHTQPSLLARQKVGEDLHSFGCSPSRFCEAVFSKGDARAY
jgi:putative transcriptional regulator